MSTDTYDLCHGHYVFTSTVDGRTHYSVGFRTPSGVHVHPDAPSGVAADKAAAIAAVLSWWLA